MTDRRASVPDTEPQHDHSAAEERLRRQLDAVQQLPDQNPNPVLRIDRAGTLAYANPASRVLVRDLGLVEGQALPDRLLGPLQEALDGPEGSLAEVEVGRRTFCFKPVAAPELETINVYATDITAARAVERFPERNPNPVLRVGEDGTLLYANEASAPVVEALGLVEGEHMPTDLWTRLCAAARSGSDEPVEVKGDGRWYELTCVPIEEMGFANVYGTDVTAMRAIRRFPLQNPNPVLRVSHDGVLLFANPAAEHIVAGFGLVEGEPMPPALMDPIRAEIDKGDCCFETETAGRVYRMTAVAAFEFGFINLYATDITAAKQVEAAHAENERLLLNILPAPIAQRLRAGEKVIADRHEDLSLLFADIVGFTQMSSELPPEHVIDLLDGLFRNLDELVDEYGLEKIKTIGDAYMVVGGLPPDADDHLARVASMALDLNEVLRQRSESQPIRMRVGLHAGPAVAGVIGAKKFIYDVWGDTVNTASRLEAYGLPERIQVTDAVQRRLEDRFEFEPRGVVELKGMGPTHTWFLSGRKNGSTRGIALA
jgi:class 3 adenylate cyclase